MTTAWDDWSTLIQLLPDFKLEETEVTTVAEFFTKAGQEKPSYVADLVEADFIEGQSGVAWPQGEPLTAVIRGALKHKAREVAAEATTAASSLQAAPHSQVPGVTKAQESYLRLVGAEPSSMAMAAARVA